MRVLRLSNEKIYIAVTYDISNNKARSKIVNILESYGFRVQESVFELELTINQYARITKSMNYWLDFAKTKYKTNQINNDSVKFYILSKVWEGNLWWRINWIWEWYKQAFFDDVLIL